MGMCDIAKWNTQFCSHDYFSDQTMEKYKKISKIADILAVTDTILMYRKTDI